MNIPDTLVYLLTVVECEFNFIMQILICVISTYIIAQIPTVVWHDFLLVGVAKCILNSFINARFLL